MKILAHIRWAYVTLIIFIALALSIVIFPLFKAPRSQKIAAKFIKILTGIKIDIKGQEDPNTQMFLINHQSDLDIEVMEIITDKALAWVAKKELFEVPFFGLALKLPEDIAVDRENKKSLLKLLKDAKDRLEKGKTLAIFPEGTRSRSDRMLPFKSGAQLIADKYKLRVQPVVLLETAKHYDIKKYWAKSGTIKVIFLPSFTADASNPDWLKELRKEMQRVYDEELATGRSSS